MASTFAAVSAFPGEKVFPTPEDGIRYADASYVDNTLSLDGRKAVMERMIQAADDWKDNYDIQWRAAEAVHAYGDTLYYKYQLDNYEAALGRKEIRNVKDVLGRSQALSAEQSRSMLELGTRTRAYADRAVQLKPDGADGHYYAAMGIATYSFGKSIVKALLEGLGPKFEGHLSKVLALDKGYRDGAAYVAYGRYYYKLPWPKKNDKKSLDLLRAAEAYQPKGTVVQDFLGDTLYDRGKKAEAVRCWEASLASPPDIYHASYLKALTAAKLKYSR